MKKAIVMLAMLVLTMGLVSAIPTTTTTTWNGAGIVETSFVAGDDASGHFKTNGNYISGEFHVTDNEDNPYGYGVDTVESKVKAHVGDGQMEYVFNKNDNYEPGYGSAGQESYTLMASDGTADFAWRTSSNYARMISSNYGWQANGQMKATGNHYIYHSFFIDDSYNEGASISVNANADTEITDMTDEHWGSSYKFGKGAGCYTNANVDISNGAGTFDLDAWSDNEITTDSGITVHGGHLNIHSDFTGGFQFSNFALEGN